MGDDSFSAETAAPTANPKGARFDIVSYGDDGQEGGEDFAADLWSSPAK